MREVSNRNFGLLIAYLLPGYIALWGIGQVSPTVAGWLAAGEATIPSVGGFLFVTVASLTVGLIASAFRWAIIDTIHHVTGITKPEWSDAQLADRLHAFELLVEHHYRYYQFYANGLIALLLAHACWRASLPTASEPSLWHDAALITIDLVLFAGSRDALSKYYRRVSRLLVQPPSQEQPR